MIHFDKRIKSEKIIFNYLTRAEAFKYVGKYGYFADYLDEFNDLTKVTATVLDEIRNVEGCFFCDQAIGGFRYFIPVDVLTCKEPEKKGRAFTNEEFLALFDSGKLHSIRHGDKQSRYVITCVYFDCEQDAVCVNLNHSDVGLDMKYLFRKAYEYFDGKEWRRFGVEEDFKDEDRSQN